MRKEPLAVFAGFFLLGLGQAAPSVTTGDAGEFTAAAATLGIAHAPGYPLFVLLAKAFGTLLPLGSWAYRTNFLSVVCGAAALALFSDALNRFGAGRAARLGAVAVLGLSPLWREQSAVTEVFALHLLCAALLLWIVASAGDRLLAAGPASALGLAFGLGLGDHQTLALILPALIIAARGRPGDLPRALACAALGTAAGFALNVVLPLRAAQGPPLDWDHATTLKAFWRLLSRKDYGSLALTVEGGQATGAEALAAQAWRSLRGMAGQLGPLGTLLALLGAAGWRRAGLRLPASAAWAWILCAGPIFLMLGRPPFDVQTSSALERFHLLPLIGAGLFVAAGLEILSFSSPLAAAAAAFAAAAALAPAAAAQSRRGDFLAQDYGRSILRELPPRSTLVMDGGDDTFYSLACLTFAARLREDVSLHDRGGLVFRSAYGPDFLSLPRVAKDDRRRAVEAPWAEDGRLWYSSLNPGLLPGWDARPAGLLRRPARPGTPFPEGGALRETLALPRAPSAAGRYRDRALLAFVYYQRGVEALSLGRVDAGASWLELAAQTGGDALWAAPAISYALALSGYEANGRKDLAAAERIYRAQLALDAVRAEPAMNLGVVLQNEGRLTEAEAALREAVRREPRLPRAWETLGALLWARGRWSECAQTYASAAALPSANPADGDWSRRAGARAGAGR
jgi:tetratricopeptide (TPR) repeat protein